MSTRAREDKTELRIARFTPQLCAAYAKALVLQTPRTEHSAEKALLATLPIARKWSQRTRQCICARLETVPDVIKELAQIRDDEFSKNLLGASERRAMLAEIARTPMTQVADEMGEEKPNLSDAEKLCIKKLKVRRFTRKDGAEVVDREIETYDRLAALRLDAELAGVLGHGTALTVNAQGSGPVQIVVMRGNDPSAAKPKPQ
jgi:hypothetical protein